MVDNNRCIPSGVASPTRSESVQEFFRERRPNPKTSSPVVTKGLLKATVKRVKSFGVVYVDRVGRR